MANEREIGKLVIRLVAEVKDLKKGLEGAQKNVKDFTDQGKKHSRDFETSLGGIKAQYLKIAAAAYAAYHTITWAINWAEIGAKAQQVEQSFEALTQSIGVNGRALINEMKKVSGVWVNETDVMIKAQRLLAEGMEPGDLINLTKASVVAAKMMGIEVSDAFKRVSEAVLTLRTGGLVEAFPMDVAEVIERYARSLGTVSKYLNEAGQRQAILNEIVRQSIEKQELLGTAMVPNNYDKVQKFNSALAQIKELIGIGISDAIFGSISLVEKFGEKLKELGGVELVNRISEMVALFSLWQSALGQIVLGIINLKRFIEKLKPKEEAPEVRFLARYEAGLKAQEEAERGAERQRRKSGIDERKRTEDLTKFRLANEEQRVTAEANIRKIGLQIRKTEEITALKKLGMDTVALELEFDKRIAQVEYESLMKSLSVRKQAEIEAVIFEAEKVADVKRKFRVLEKEAAQKLALELGEIEAKRALSFEGLYGMTEQELQKRTEYSRALREGDLDEALRANKVQEALEARLSDQIIKNKMAEDQFAMTKEDRLEKEIEITKELMGYTQERLSNLDEEDDAWISMSNQVEGYANKIKELNFELDRQMASFGQLVELGLKKYSVSLKENLIDNMETLVPRAIDTAGGSLKTLIKDLSSGTKSLSESFKDMARNFGESVMDMIIDIGLLMIKMELLKALDIDVGTGKTGGGEKSTGSWIMSILGLIGGLFQTGGQIKGPSGIDRVPIRATAGEYMHPVSSVQYYGLDVMEKMRARMIPKEALLSLASGRSAPMRINPSFAMQAGGLVPSLSGAEGEDKKTEITLINVVDQKEMDYWAASARGQNAIINVISSRAETVRKVLQ